MRGLGELVLLTLAYSGAGLLILVAGYFVVDLLTPGHLGRQVMEDRNVNAGILLAAALFSLGLIQWFAVFFSGGGWDSLIDVVVFGAIGIALQAVGFLLLDVLTPGKLGAICMATERFHPASAVAASVQVAVALVVCAALTG
jgi:uncharacterized membrane protein YjfL (UPF0719 family)